MNKVFPNLYNGSNKIYSIKPGEGIKPEAYKMSKTIFVFFIFYVCRLTAQNIPLSFSHLSREDGLSQSSAHCILQDKYGFLWIGTENGLNRYDGYEFKVYKHNPRDSNSLSANLVTCLYEDKQGTLWVGTSDGLNKFDQKGNRFIHFLADVNGPDKLSGKAIVCVTEDDYGSLWIGTYLGGLSRMNRQNDTFVNYLPDVSRKDWITDNTIMAICCIGENLWLGTFSGGLFRFNLKEEKFFHYGFNAASRSKLFSLGCVFTIQKGTNGSLFIGTNKGLNCFYPEENRLESFTTSSFNNASISSNDISAIFTDSRGTVWIGTRDGLNIFYPAVKSFLRILKNENDPHSINDNSIYSIYQDRNNNIWVGTRSGGLNKLSLDAKKFSIISNKKESSLRLSSGTVLSFAEFNKNFICIGSDNGLNIVDKGSGKVKYFFAQSGNNSFSNDVIFSLLNDDDKFLWIGTEDGIFVYNETTKKISRYVLKVEGSICEVGLVYKIMKDSYKNIWIGTFVNGLYKISPDGTVSHFVHNSYDPGSLSDNVVEDILEDRNKNIWVCTINGLNKYKSGRFIRYLQNTGDRLTVTQFNCIRQNSNYRDKLSSEIFWLGTQGNGLIKFDAKNSSIEVYDEQKGLADNIVNCILEDDHNNLWIATNKGLSKLNPASGSIKNYYVNDGLPANEFMMGSCLKSVDGKLYFGSIAGAVFFNPDSILDSNFLPKPVITNFRIFNKPVSGTEFFSEGDKLNISYRDNFFSFEFSALDYSNPMNNQYAFMLEGVDDGWIYSGKRRYAAYTNLEPGKYKLRVKASNSDGVWNKKGVALSIIILPPYWQTWWFKTTGALSFLLIMFLLYRSRINKLKREKIVQQKFSNQLIESQEKERKPIASELHDSIGQNLIIIKNRSMIGFDNCADASAREQLKEISDISSQTLTSVREISYNLRPHQLGKLGLTKTISSIMKLVQSGSKINFVKNIDNVDNTLAPEDEIHFCRILQECLNNAVKHSNAYCVEIQIRNLNDKIQFNYRDNGVGFDKSSLSEIKGMGFLDITERVNILNGTQNISSEINRGTKILITIPVNNRVKNE